MRTTTFKITPEQKKNIETRPLMSMEEKKQLMSNDAKAHCGPLPRPTLIGEGRLARFYIGQIVEYNFREYILEDAIKGRKEFFRFEAKIRDLKTNKVKTISGYHKESDVRGHKDEYFYSESPLVTRLNKENK